MTEFAGVSERAALGTADRRSLLEKSPALKLMLSIHLKRCAVILANKVQLHSF